MSITFDKIIKILLKEGGYPSKKVSSLLGVLGMNKEEFMDSVINFLGQENANKFFEKSIRNLSRDGVHLTLSPTNLSPDVENKKHFIEIDLSKARTDIGPIRNLVVYDWDFGNSYLTASNDDGETFAGTIEEVLEWYILDDPYSEEDIYESFWYTIEGQLEEVLGVPVRIERKKVRE